MEAFITKECWCSPGFMWWGTCRWETLALMVGRPVAVVAVAVVQVLVVESTAAARSGGKRARRGVNSGIMRRAAGVAEMVEGTVGRLPEMADAERDLRAGAAG